MGNRLPQWCQWTRKKLLFSVWTAILGIFYFCGFCNLRPNWKVNNSRRRRSQEKAKCCCCSLSLFLSLFFSGWSRHKQRIPFVCWSFSWFFVHFLVFVFCFLYLFLNKQAQSRSHVEFIALPSNNKKRMQMCEWVRLCVCTCMYNVQNKRQTNIEFKWINNKK